MTITTDHTDINLKKKGILWKTYAHKFDNLDEM